METIALVACSKAKRPGRHQAKNLYNSTLFTYSRKYAETHADREAANNELLPYQRSDFDGLFEAMVGVNEYAIGNVFMILFVGMLLYLLFEFPFRRLQGQLPPSYRPGRRHHRLRWHRKSRPYREGRLRMSH